MNIQNFIEGDIDKNELREIIEKYLVETLDLNGSCSITLDIQVSEEYQEGDWRAEFSTIPVFKKIHFKIEK